MHRPSLAGLRLPPGDDAELVWFFGDARGQLGLRAQSYEPSGHSTDPDTAGEMLYRQMGRAERFRIVQRTLERMPRRGVRVLQRWCGEGRWPQAIAAEFDRLAGVALLAARDVAPLSVRRVEGWLETACTASSRLILVRVRARAEALLIEAAGHYAQAKPKTRKRGNS